MRNKINQINVRQVIVGLSLFLLNLCGTLAWVYLYIRGDYKQLWILPVVVLCFLTALILGVKSVKQLRIMFRTKNNV